MANNIILVIAILTIIPAVVAVSPIIPVIGALLALFASALMGVLRPYLQASRPSEDLNALKKYRFFQRFPPPNKDIPDANITAVLVN